MVTGRTATNPRIKRLQTLSIFRRLQAVSRIPVKLCRIRRGTVPLAPVYFGRDRVMVDLYLFWGAGLSVALWQLAGADSVLAGFPVPGELTAAGAQAA